MEEVKKPCEECDIITHSSRGGIVLLIVPDVWLGWNRGRLILLGCCLAVALGAAQLGLIVVGAGYHTKA